MNYLGAILPTGIATVAILAGYFTYTPPRVLDERVMIDITDTITSRPEAEQLISRYGFDKNPWNGGSFHVKSISDLAYNQTFTAVILPADFFTRLLSNEIERDAAIAKFTGEEERILDDIMKVTIGRNHSSIYRAVAEELNDLAESNADDKILCIYGDLREHSTLLNLYTSEGMNLLRGDQDSIILLLAKEVPLANLSGINAYLIYQPATYEDDEPYHHISQLYKKMLEDKGATVKITANISL